LAGSVIGLALLAIIVPICGALSDRIGRRKTFPIVGAIGMIVLLSGKLSIPGEGKRSQ
jgi:MFS family permease